MLSKKILFTILISILYLFIASNSYADNNTDFIIIVNKNNPVSSMSKTELKRIYKKKQQVWDDGGLISPVDLSGKILSVFYKRIFNYSKTEIETYWIRQVFTRSLKPPIHQTSPEAVKRFVSSNKDAIGYIPAHSLDNSVKQINLTRR